MEESLTVEEKIIRGSELKATGNRLVGETAGKEPVDARASLEDALAAYLDACATLEAKTRDGGSKEEWETIKGLRVSCHCNAALMYHRLGDRVNILPMCDAALQLDVLERAGEARAAD